MTLADVAGMIELFAEGFSDAPRTARIARTPATLRYFAWRNRTGPATALLEGDELPRRLRHRVARGPAP